MWENIDKIVEIFRLLFGCGIFIWTTNMLNDTKLEKVNREFGAFLYVCAFFIMGMLVSEFFIMGFGAFVGVRTFQKVKENNKTK